MTASLFDITYYVLLHGLNLRFGNVSTRCIGFGFYICLYSFWFAHPRCGTEYVGLALLATWHPAAPFPAAACPGQAPGCRNFIRLRYHYHPTFRLSVLTGFYLLGKILCLRQTKSTTDSPCRTAAHTFPSSITIPCFICRLSFRHTYCPDYRQVFLRKAHSHIIRIISLPNVPDILCPQRYSSLPVRHFRASPYWYELVKVHVLPVNFPDLQQTLFGCKLTACQRASLPSSHPIPFGRLQPPLLR